MKATIGANKKDIPPLQLRKRVQAEGWWPELFTSILVFLNLSAVFFWPSYTVFNAEGEAAYCGVIMMITVVHWMKLISYAHCNQDYRCA